jgi:aspartyl-tRNA(Asn)/glutamyl-tRNA(Gln) amidotransferase subunit C
VIGDFFHTYAGIPPGKSFFSPDVPDSPHGRGNPHRRRGTVKITMQEVGYVSHLARLDLGEDEKETFTSQLNNILLYMEILNGVDTEGIKPMTHAISQSNVFRDDEERKSIGAEMALTNAPDGEMGFFGVPKIIE